MRIDLFRAGSHTAMGGQKIDFTEADLAASAAAYDPALHEAPVVVGHPTHDAPAYGWVESLAASGGAMAATAGQVDPAFAELMDAGRYKKVSASFYPPGSDLNPVPGVYYLRHVGVLGAQPPAVKGLKPVEFADDGPDCVTIEFGEQRAGTVARLFADAWGQLRDWMIGKHGLEEANKAMPSWNEDWARDIAAEARAEDHAAQPMFADAAAGFASLVEAIVAAPAESAPSAAFAEEAAATFMKLVAKVTPSTTDPIVALPADFAERETNLVARETAFAEGQAKVRRTADATALDGLVAAGKLAPGWRPQLLAFMERLDATAEVSFSEGAAAETPHAFMHRLLAGGGVVVDFSERAHRDLRQPTGGDKTGRLAVRARELVDAATAAGKSLSYAEAVGRADREEETQ